jgi:hypothetical protein
MGAMKPVVALDIDGTMGDYHKHFTMFAEMWTGRSMPDPKRMNPAQPFHQHLGMSKATYRQCKLAYRQGGMKRSMPPMFGCDTLTRELRRAGAEVFICTTRPYLRLDTIDPDTRHWLRRNHVQFDGLLYGEHKYRQLLTIVNRSRVIGVLDDEVDLCRRAADLFLPTYIKDAPYNRHTQEFQRVYALVPTTIDPLPGSQSYDFLPVMLRAIAKYKENNQ